MAQIRYCYGCGLSCSCSSSSTHGPGNSTCSRSNCKKKKHSDGGGGCSIRRPLSGRNGFAGFPRAWLRTGMEVMVHPAEKPSSSCQLPSIQPSDITQHCSAWSDTVLIFSDLGIYFSSILIDVGQASKNKDIE